MVNIYKVLIKFSGDRDGTAVKVLGYKSKGRWFSSLATRSVVRISQRKRPLGRPRRRWVDNIRTDLQEVGCGCMDWIGLAQDRDM